MTILAWRLLGAGVLVVGLLAGVAIGIERIRSSGEAAGAAIAQQECSASLDGISQAARKEKTRLEKLALDIGIQHAKTVQAYERAARRLRERSENEIAANPLPVACDWSLDRVRLVNEAATAAGGSDDREGGPGPDVPATVPAPSTTD